jgi:hypothetical protein
VPYVGHKASYSTLGGAVVELKREQGVYKPDTGVARNTVDTHSITEG